jgi:uncharacterized protein (TIGR00369 family)
MRLDVGLPEQLEKPYADHGSRRAGNPHDETPGYGLSHAGLHLAGLYIQACPAPAYRAEWANAAPGSLTVTDAHTLNRDPLPFARLLEIEFREAGRDRIVAEMTVRSDLCTAGGRVHGGALMALADNTAAMGTAISLPDGAMGTTTIESKTNFVGGAALGTKLVAIAVPVHRGRQTQVWQTRIETADGRLIALVSQTQMVLYPRP